MEKPRRQSVADWLLRRHRDHSAMMRAIGGDPNDVPDEGELPSGKTLKLLRVQCGLNQTQVAKLASINKETVVNLERGKKVRVNNVRAVNDALVAEYMLQRKTQAAKKLGMTIEEYEQKFSEQIDLPGHGGVQQSPPTQSVGVADDTTSDIEARFRELEKDHEALIRAMSDVQKLLTDALAEHGQPAGHEDAGAGTTKTSARGRHRKTGR